MIRRTVLLSLLFCVAAGQRTFIKHFITDASAVCTDGSQGVYYTSMSPATAAAWLIWLDGPTNAANITANALSTYQWPDTVPFSYGPFSSNHAEDFAAYSLSVLMYCSDDFYLGDSGIHRGSKILSAWLQELSPDMASAPSIVAGGATAGALGLVSSMNILENILGTSRPISLLLDSPFFTPTVTASAQIRDIASSSPSPVCRRNQTHVVYSASPYDFVPCCLDYMCASDSLPAGTRVMLLQSLAYATSVNDALMSSSSDTGKFSESQLYNLSLTTTKSGALVTTALRQAANERPETTSYIAYSCIETPILSPFGNPKCLETDFTDTQETWATLEGLEAVATVECKSAKQASTIQIGDFQYLWTNEPSTWNDIRVSPQIINAGRSLSNDPSIATLVGQWANGITIRNEEACSGMNCNPTCTQTTIELTVNPFVHISSLTGLYLLAVVVVAIIALVLAYGKPKKDKTPIDPAQRGMINSSALSQSMAAQRCLETRGLTYWNKNSVSKSNPPSLKSISLTIPQGSLVGIIGGSGCGKSTLLELLAGRRDAGSWSGDILCCGKQVTSEWLARNTGIVRQSLSPLVDGLTLLQNLEYAAMLRVRGSAEFIRNRIDFVLDKLELGEFRDSLTRTLSGGQRKRAEVALELLTQPDILFLDEPTSALDSRTALNFMDWIAKVSKSTGSSIILSIHQPREEIWSLFTHIVLLEKGFLVYLGPPFAIPDSVGLNPADLAVELAGNRREAMMTACDAWCKATIADDDSDDSPKSPWWKKCNKSTKKQRPNVSTMARLTTPAHKQRRSTVRFVESSIDLSAAANGGNVKQGSSTPCMSRQIRSFLLRLMAVHPPWKLTTLRSVFGLSMLSVFVGLLLAVIFWSMDTESVRTKALAFLVLVPAFLSNSFVVSYVCEDIPIYLIERSNYYVTPIAFFIHHILHLTVYIIMPFTVFPIVEYALLFGRVLDDFKWKMFLGMVGFSQMCFVAFLSLFVFSCFFLRGNQSNAMIMNSSLESLFALFSGFLAPLPSLTLAPIRYMSYLSPAMWGYVGVTYAIANVQFPGDCGTAASATESTCALSQSGNLLIYALGFNDLNPITAFLVLLGWSILFFFLSWLVLARPWDKGPVKLMVVSGPGEEGIEALARIAQVEQENFLKSLTGFSEKDAVVRGSTATVTPVPEAADVI